MIHRDVQLKIVTLEGLICMLTVACGAQGIGSLIKYRLNGIGVSLQDGFPYSPRTGIDEILLCPPSLGVNLLHSLLVEGKAFY